MPSSSTTAGGVAPSPWRVEGPVVGRGDALEVGRVDAVRGVAGPDGLQRRLLVGGEPADADLLHRSMPSRLVAALRRR